MARRGLVRRARRARSPGREPPATRRPRSGRGGAGARAAHARPVVRRERPPVSGRCPSPARPAKDGSRFARALRLGRRPRVRRALPLAARSVRGSRAPGRFSSRRPSTQGCSRKATAPGGASPLQRPSWAGRVSGFMGRRRRRPASAPRWDGRRRRCLLLGLRSLGGVRRRDRGAGRIVPGLRLVFARNEQGRRAHAALEVVFHGVARGDSGRLCERGSTTWATTPRWVSRASDRLEGASTSWGSSTDVADVVLRQFEGERWDRRCGRATAHRLRERAVPASLLPNVARHAGRRARRRRHNDLGLLGLDLEVDPILPWR